MPDATASKRSATKYFSRGKLFGAGRRINAAGGKLFCAGHKLNAAGGIVNPAGGKLFCAGGILNGAVASLNGAGGIVNDNRAKVHTFSVCLDSRRMRELIADNTRFAVKYSKCRFDKKYEDDHLSDFDVYAHGDRYFFTNY